MSSRIGHPLQIGIKWSVILLMWGIALLIIVDAIVSMSVAGRIYLRAEALPKMPVALVLGTSKYIGKTPNDFYRFRIDAAIDLIEQHKVRGLILSGDNATRYYNEPITMQRDLLKAGVPASQLTLDYAGFRTLDSILRVKRVFAQQQVIIVSQYFHCERALFIALKNDLDAVCYAARNTRGWAAVKIRLREALARFQAMFDLYLLNTDARFYGPTETVNLVADT